MVVVVVVRVDACIARACAHSERARGRRRCVRLSKVFGFELHARLRVSHGILDDVHASNFLERPIEGDALARPGVQHGHSGGVFVVVVQGGVEREGADVVVGAAERGRRFEQLE